MKIRESLHYHTYVEHSESLYQGANEMLRLFHSVIHEPISRDIVRIKQLGYGRSASLLYAISVELIFKARALYEERGTIEEFPDISFSTIRKKWGNSGHNIQDIIDCYSLVITPTEQNVIEELQPYMVWAGRFPFPLKESDVLDYEQRIKSVVLSSNIDELVLNLIDKQKKCMGYNQEITER